MTADLIAQVLAHHRQRAATSETWVPLSAGGVGYPAECGCRRWSGEVRKSGPAGAMQRAADYERHVAEQIVTALEIYEESAA